MGHKAPSAKRLAKRARRQYLERLNAQAAIQEATAQERQEVADQALTTLRLTVERMEADLPNASALDLAAAASILSNIALDFMETSRNAGARIT